MCDYIYVKPIFIWPSIVILIIFIIELLIPKVASFGYSPHICLACSLSWLAITYLSFPKYYARTKIFFLLLSYITLVTIPLLSGHNVIANRYASMSLVILGSVIYDYYYTTGNLKLLLKILFISLLSTIITMFYTYNELLSNPYICRSIKTSGEYTQSVLSRGVGGYSFIYYTSALCVPVIFLAFKSHSKNRRIFFSFFFIILLFFILKSNYTTAFITAIISSSIYTIHLLTENRKKILIRFIVLTGVIISLLTLFDIFKSNIISYIPPRIAEVLVSQNDKSIFLSVIDEFLLDRWPLMEESFYSFTQHPILGLLGGSFSDFDNKIVDISQHSFILDTLALYGIGSIIIIVYSLSQPFLNPRKSEKYINIAMLFCMFTIYVCNNASDSIAFVLMIVFPAAKDAIYHKYL